MEPKILVKLFGAVTWNGMGRKRMLSLSMNVKQSLKWINSFGVNVNSEIFCASEPNPMKWICVYVNSWMSRKIYGNLINMSYHVRYRFVKCFAEWKMLCNNICNGGAKKKNTKWSIVARSINWYHRWSLFSLSELSSECWVMMERWSTIKCNASRWMNDPKIEMMQNGDRTKDRSTQKTQTS
jgi:hypothetical protein